MRCTGCRPRSCAAAAAPSAGTPPRVSTLDSGAGAAAGVEFTGTPWGDGSFSETSPSL